MKADERLDEGFELLKACSREQAPFDTDLEERLMNELAKTQRSWISRPTTVAAVVVVCVAVTGVSLAATGSLGRILGWETVGNDGKPLAEPEPLTVGNDGKPLAAQEAVEIGNDGKPVTVQEVVEVGNDGLPLETVGNDGKPLAEPEPITTNEAK